MIVFLAFSTTVLGQPFWEGTSYRPTSWNPKDLSSRKPFSYGRIGPYSYKTIQKPDIDNLYQQYQKNNRQQEYKSGYLADQYGVPNENFENKQGPETNQQPTQDYGPPNQKNYEYNPPKPITEQNKDIDYHNVKNKAEEPKPKETVPPKSEYGAPNLPNQEYGTPHQQYGTPILEEQFSEPKSLPKNLNPNVQAYVPKIPNTTAPKTEIESKEILNKEIDYNLWEQQPPKDEPPKNWQQVDSSLSWYRPTENHNPKYVWGRESQEHYQKDGIDEEAQRLLEQIRQYRIKSSIRDGKILPADFDTSDYKKRFHIRTRPKDDRYSKYSLFFLQGSQNLQVYIFQVNIFLSDEPPRRQPYVYGPPPTIYGPPITTLRPPTSIYGTTKTPMDTTTQVSKTHNIF